MVLPLAAVAIISLNRTNEGLTRVESERLSVLGTTSELAEGYGAFLAIGMDGLPFASSDPSYLGVSFADQSYFKNAVNGVVDAGSASLDTVTRKPSVPDAAMPDLGMRRQRPRGPELPLRPRASCFRRSPPPCSCARRPRRRRGRSLRCRRRAEGSAPR